jgi:hypothetical protein
MNLSEWTNLYIKNKDILQKKLISIETQDEFIKCNYKDGQQTYYFENILTDKVIEYLPRDRLTIVCLNNKRNINFVFDKWDELIKNRSLILIFCNPETNNKWIIKPYVHNIVTEKSFLKIGLLSLAESVEEISL